MKTIILPLVGLLAITAVLAGSKIVKNIRLLLADEPSTTNHGLKLRSDENPNFARASGAENTNNAAAVSYGSSGSSSGSEKSGNGLNVEHSSGHHRVNSTRRHESENRVRNNISRRGNRQQRRDGKNGNTNDSELKLSTSGYNLISELKAPA